MTKEQGAEEINLGSMEHRVCHKIMVFCTMVFCALRISNGIALIHFSGHGDKTLFLNTCKCMRSGGQINGNQWLSNYHSAVAKF